MASGEAARHGRLRRWLAPAGLFSAGSWHEAVSAFSENPDAVYSFFSLMAIKSISIVDANNGWTSMDPGYYYQFLPPHEEARTRTCLSVFISSRQRAAPSATQNNGLSASETDRPVDARRT